MTRLLFMRNIAGILLAVCFFPIPANALLASQSTYGELIVIAANTEAPVEGAIVLLEGGLSGSRVSVTNKDGSCRFSGLQPGIYALDIFLRSYFVAPEDANELTHFEISRGEKRSIKVNLTKGGVITGRVLNPNGLSLVGVPLTALEVKTTGTTSAPSAKESNVTALSDDRGEFRIYGLRPGRYAIAVNAQRNLFPLRSAASFYYPAQREVVNARLFDVLIQQETKALDLIIDLDGAIQNTLSGRVHGPHQAPLAGVNVSLRQINGGHVTDVVASDREGLFNFEGLPHGRYVVRAQAAEGSYFSTEKELTVKDFSKTEILLELRPYIVLAGNVYLRDKTRISSLSLKMRLASLKTGESIDFASTKNGSFTARSGLLGTFWWSFPELPKDYYLEKVRIGNKAITYGPLKLDQQLNEEKISLQFASGATTLSGQLRKGVGDTCSQVVVYAVATDERTHAVRSVRKADTCTDDSFSIYSLAPGAYYVFTMPIIKSGSMPVASSQSRFALPDDQVQILEKAVAHLKEIEQKPLVTEPRKTYRGISPIVLGRH